MSISYISGSKHASTFYLETTVKSKPLVYRILFTVLALTLLWGLNKLIIPGINPEFKNLLEEMKKYVSLDSGAIGKFRLFGLGLKPLLAAIGLTLFFYGLVPKNNRLPLKKIRRKIALPTFLVMLFIVCVQAIFVGKWGSNSQFDGIAFTTLPVSQFIPLVVLWLTGGTILLLRILRLNNERGISSGILLFLFLVNVSSYISFWQIPNTSTSSSSDIFAAVAYPEAEAARSEATGNIYGLLFLVTLLVILFSFLRKKMTYSSSNGSTFTTKIPVNLFGLSPLVLLLIPSTVLTLLLSISPNTPKPDSIIMFYMRLMESHGPLINFSFLLLSSFVLYTVNFSGSDVETTMEQYGYTQAQNEKKPTFYLKLFAICNGLFMFVLFWLANKIHDIGITLNINFGAVVIIIVVYAVIILGKKIFFSMKSPAIPVQEEEHILEEPDTLLEAELMVEVLKQEEINARIYNSRIIEYTGTDAFWKFTRPRFISLSANPTLDNGTVLVIVSKEEVEKAKKILHRFNKNPELPEVFQ